MLHFGRLRIMSFLRHQLDAEVPESESVFSMSAIRLLDADMVYIYIYGIYSGY